MSGLSRLSNDRYVGNESALAKIIDLMLKGYIPKISVEVVPSNWENYCAERHLHIDERHEAAWHV